MKKIDRQTVQKILDAADIVEVVSDFVTLRRRGANYIGLCPFHNERTPSFSVSKSKGICKCFSCGKGGSPVNFLMELENMTYQEALRYLAKKYNIEIKEHEMSEAEREAESKRESMFAVNQFAMEHFARNLTQTDDGRAIGLAYFRERGINDQMISRFRLGYALERSKDLYETAIRRGYSEQYLLETGLCSRSDRGPYDRFRGRVIYPVLSISGKVVAFGGRTLRKDKSMAKYVNSPESVIYSKRRELYGLYQARQAIVKADKCILVEGYMDVISMHQAGVENVVASSGTSLTAEQVRLIHRFTNNITVIYDADSAGVKASLRSIDMLLLEGMDIKVLSLPEGEDPDSFAQTHSSTEVEEYIAANEIDFIRFKTNTLLKGSEDDPNRRARVIQDIIRSISLVGDTVQRNVYITETSRLLGIDDKVLSAQVRKIGSEQAQKIREEEQRSREMAKLPKDEPPVQQQPVQQQPQTPQQTPSQTPQQPPQDQIDPEILRMSQRSTHVTEDEADARTLLPLEHELMRYVLRYAMVTLTEAVDDDGRTWPVSVYDYIADELSSDGITLLNPLYRRAFAEVGEIREKSWAEDLAAKTAEFGELRKKEYAEGLEQIRRTGNDLGTMEAREQELNQSLDERLAQRLRDYSATYVEKILASSPDDELRRLTVDLVSDKYVLSKVHTKYSKIPSEIERLEEIVPLAVFGLKAGIIDCRTRRIRTKIKAACSDPTASPETIRELMSENVALDNMKKELARYLGERIILPR